METVQFVEGLQRDIRELAQIGGEELVQAAQRLEGAVKQSATLRLIDVLTAAALELSEQLPSGHVDVRVAAQEPQLVFVQEEEAEQATASAPPPEDEQTRITLRLPESLKAAIEAAAAAEGISVNAWLVRALQRAVSGGGPRAQRSGKRITGFSQA